MPRVRRLHSKRLDFNSLAEHEVHRLEDWINSIHMESLNEETAYACDQRLSKAA